jgi:uncharacterized protein YndB with AHSA1/START domain
MSLLTQNILPKDQPQIITTRLIAAPRDLIWKVITTPEHLQQFWGPDGTDYPNRFIFLTIAPPHVLRFEHGNGGEEPLAHKFTGEIELTEEKGKSRIELRLIGKDMATRDMIAQYALEDGRQNIDRLAAFVAPMVKAKNQFEIERSDPVSQKRLFRACTDVKEMMQ